MRRTRYLHEELTPREREVLDLIAEGLTNEEIADRLQISFGTAKYHVAEILSRLGVSSREEAVAVVRQREEGRRQPALAMGLFDLLRSRVAILTFGAAVVAVVLLLVSGLVGLPWSSSSSLSPTEDELAVAATDFLLAGDETPESFYFQAKIQYEAGNTSTEDDVLDSLRGWHQAPDRWRYEFGHSDPLRALEGGFQVFDGELVWFYQAETNTFTRESLESYFALIPPEMRRAPAFPAMSFFIGPLPVEREAFLATRDNWTLLEQRAGETIAGRATELVRIGAGGGELHLWLDREYAFVLRQFWEDASAGSLLVEITELELNQSIEPERFLFVAPEGAEEVASIGGSSGGSSGGSGSVSGPGSSLATFTVPAGFFNPVEVQGGYSVRSEESSHDGRRTTRFAVRFEDSAGGELTITQQFRAGGLPDAQKTGQALSVRGTTAYNQSSDGETRLVWSEADIVVTLTSPSLNIEELLRIAEGMQASD